MMLLRTEGGCIGIERAPVDVRELVVPCTRKPNRECWGFNFCTEHYQSHKAGVHPKPDLELRRRRRAA